MKTNLDILAKPNINELLDTWLRDRCKELKIIKPDVKINKLAYKVDLELKYNDLTWNKSWTEKELLAMDAPPTYAIEQEIIKFYKLMQEAHL